MTFGRPRNIWPRRDLDSALELWLLSHVGWGAGPGKKLIAMGLEAVLRESNDRGYQDSRAD